jgi:signal transduction histidine kinase
VAPAHLFTDASRSSTALSGRASRPLAALDEQKDSLLTAVSHELRTPLANILGA